MPHRAGLLRDLWRTPLETPPGSRVACSDPGFIVLGELVAVAAGHDLDTAVRTLVTGPLGLTAVTFNPNGPGECFPATERRPDGSAWAGTVHDENARLVGGMARQTAVDNGPGRAKTIWLAGLGEGK